MSRIGQSTPALQSQHILQANRKKLDTSLTRLATGLKINMGKDDPAGLIAGMQILAQLEAENQGIRNAQRADAMLNVAEGGLSQIGDQLADLKRLAVKNADGTLSDAERAANQMQIDSILGSINRTASTSRWQDKPLLDGSLGYQTSGVDGDKVAGHHVHSARGVGASGKPVEVQVTQAAERGGLFMTVDENPVDPNDEGVFRVEVAGNEGTQSFSFSAGTTRAEMVDQINEWTESTGVRAELDAPDGTDGIRFMSSEYGSDEHVSVRVEDDGGRNGEVYRLKADQPDPADNGEVDWASGRSLQELEGEAAVRDEGVDVGGTINGRRASGDGQTLSVNSDDLAMEIALREAAASTVGPSFEAMRIDGGGATFNIGGEVDAHHQVSVGMGPVHTSSLGRVYDESGGQVTQDALHDLRSGGSLDTSGGTSARAMDVIDRAISDVATLRGRIGGIQKDTIQPMIRSMQQSVQSQTQARSEIMDTDYAEETAKNVRYELLNQAAINSLSVANAQRANVLSLFM